MKLRTTIVIGILLLLGALSTVAIPLKVLQPFSPQGATELAVALWCRQWGVWTAAIFALASSWLFLRQRRWQSFTLAALTIGAAALNHFNWFETMFHPAGAPVLAAAKDAKLDDDEVLLAVQLNGQARAYPIRMLAYHHIVNDVVGREPIVGTY